MILNSQNNLNSSESNINKGMIAGFTFQSGYDNIP